MATLIYMLPYFFKKILLIIWRTIYVVKRLL